MKHLKEEFDKLTFKETLMYCITIISLLAGFVLLFCGLFIAPKGEIHESVLTAFGIVLVFVGMLLGLDLKYSNMTASFKKVILDMLSEMNGKEQERVNTIEKVN